MKDLLLEAKDLNLYKQLLVVFGEYSDKIPATQVSKLFADMVKLGLKVVPTDKRAQEIIGSILAGVTSIPDMVSQLLNLRFADLGIVIRPMYKNGNAKNLAFWKKTSDGKVYDKVFALLDFNGGSGFWTNATGDKVSLIDLT